MGKRAFGHEDKQARGETILRAASALFGDGLRDLPSVAQIADGAGLAKGTVYLYFRTKEAIFSALLLEGWGKVVDLVGEVFASPADPSGAIDSFLAAYVSYLGEHRELLRLDALRPTLERNLELRTLIAFKRMFMERLIDGGALIENALQLGQGRGIQLLVRTHALTCGLWQSLGPDTEMAPSAEFVAYHPDFLNELSEALSEYWRGALSFRPKGAL